MFEIIVEVLERGCDSLMFYMVMLFFMCGINRKVFLEIWGFLKVFVCFFIKLKLFVRLFILKVYRWGNGGMKGINGLFRIVVKGIERKFYSFVLILDFEISCGF